MCITIARESGIKLSTGAWHRIFLGTIPPESTSHCTMSFWDRQAMWIMEVDRLRLDRYLAQMSLGTRSEVKKFIKSGLVFVNDENVLQPEYKVGDEDIVLFDGKPVVYQEHEYYMLNKPAGVVSATKDRECETVISLVTDRKRADLFPVGRLDKDTEGLLLLTNDGALAHQLLSPKKHVWKTYLVKAAGRVGESDIVQLEQGVDIGDKKRTLPAKARILPAKDCRGREDAKNESGEDVSEVTWLELSICEGRYHQIKRMMSATGHPVLYLKRIAMGGISLDETLEPGEYRKISPEELRRLKES
jgi:16S rRNA pseudouridine516 synthase